MLLEHPDDTGFVLRDTLVVSEPESWVLLNVDVPDLAAELFEFLFRGLVHPTLFELGACLVQLLLEHITLRAGLLCLRLEGFDDLACLRGDVRVELDVEILVSGIGWFFFLLFGIVLNIFLCFTFWLVFRLSLWFVAGFVLGLVLFLLIFFTFRSSIGIFYRLLLFLRLLLGFGFGFREWASVLPFDHAKFGSFLVECVFNTVWKFRDEFFVFWSPRACISKCNPSCF